MRRQTQVGNAKLGNYMKLHFQKLQEGRETVEESVWENVKSEPSADWLADEPTSEEIHICAKQMRNGKAAGRWIGSGSHKIDKPGKQQYWQHSQSPLQIVIEP